MRFIAALLAALCINSALAEEPAQVLMLGVFHFANPGKDMVKSEQINVMTAENQEYLEQLAKRFAQFKPTAVLLEYDDDRDEVINQRYQQYLAGDFELGSNEVYQLGFRIAHAAGLDRVDSFDEGEIGWNAEPLFAHMADHEPAMDRRLKDLYATMSAQFAQDHATKTLRELLIDRNQASDDSLNKGSYLITNAVGREDGSFVGADAAASWWHRNFRMYARIQHLAQPGSRVLVIGGQGHTAILKDLLKDDPDRVSVDVMPYLQDE